MSFLDNPTVDANSERSEESVLKVKGVFNRKAGFISREENPDYGVDIDVELIAAHSATSNSFAVQIKSTSEVNIINREKEKFISLEFSTSRLGYLCRRPPAYGLIVIYDESTQTCYYDYVEDIVNRLARHRDDDEWKNQEHVNIRLPLAILNAESAIRIHEKMLIRFSNHERLIGAFGHLYRIPSHEHRTSDAETDFNDPKQVERILKEMGLDLFNSQEYSMILDLLARLPSNVISKSKDILLVAAITNGQVGMIIDCSYYLEKCERFVTEYNDDEKFLLEYTRLMVGFKKGNLNQKEFEKGLSELKQKSNNILNILTLDINLIYIKFLTGIDEGRVDENTLTLIREIFSKIEQSGLPAKDKVLLKLFNLENLHNYGTDLLLRDAGKFRIQMQMGIYVPENDRAKRASGILNILNSANSEAHNILTESKVSNNKLANAFAAYYKARFFFSTKYHTMMLTAQEEPVGAESLSKIYEYNLNFCYESISLFFDLGMLHEAHQALCCAYEIQTLYRVMYKEDIGSKTVADVESTIRQVELETGISKYESIVEPTYNAFRVHKEGNDTTWASVADNEVEKFAKLVLEAYGIPEERLVNIVSDINTYKTFEKECTNEDIELLQDLSHLQSAATIYASAPIYVMRSKKTGIQSKPSSNIHELLDQFANIIKRQT